MKQLPVSLWKLTPICSYVGNYIGGIYEGLNSALEDLVAEVNRVKTIELDGKGL